jgi:hypothetical protein
VLKLGQGRAAGESPLVLACIFVLGSHDHHLRGNACPANAARPDPLARRRVLLVAASCAPVAADGQGQRARKHRAWLSSAPPVE